MGNDIARQFAHLPADDAADRIAAHLEKFWDPRMRERLTMLLGDPAMTREADPLLVAAAGTDRH